MAPRTLGATFGLLAFSTTIVAGLWSRNSADVILSRALWAMFLFCVVGLSVGAAVQLVVREHTARRERELFPDEHVESDNAKEQIKSTGKAAKPMQN